MQNHFLAQHLSPLIFVILPDGMHYTLFFLNSYSLVQVPVISQKERCIATSFGTLIFFQNCNNCCFTDCNPLKVERLDIKVVSLFSPLPAAATLRNTILYLPVILHGCRFQRSFLFPKHKFYQHA